VVSTDVLLLATVLHSVELSLSQVIAP
jgi:hypothetical protein